LSYFRASFAHTTATSVFYTLSLHDALPIFVLVELLLDGFDALVIEERVLVDAFSGHRVEPGGTGHVRITVGEPIEMVQEHLNGRSEEHTSELQSRFDLVCRLLLENKERISD